MILALVLSLVVGLTLGFFGGGGSILALPILVYVVGLSPRDAVAGSLFVVAVASAAALAGQARAGFVQVRLGLLFGAASMVGAFTGGRVSHLVPQTILLTGFAAMMLATGAAMLRPRADRAGAVAERHRDRPSRVRALLAGVAIGAVTGLVGAGGGFVVVPALTLLLGLPMRSAVATSLLVIMMNSLAGFAGAVAHASLPWATIGAMAFAAALASLLGTWVARRVGPASLRRAFGGFIVAMAAFMLWKQLPDAIMTSLAAHRTLLAAGIVAVAVVAWRLLVASARPRVGAR